MVKACYTVDTLAGACRHCTAERPLVVETTVASLAAATINMLVHSQRELLLYVMYSLGEYSLAQSIPLLLSTWTALSANSSWLLMLLACSAHVVGVLSLILLCTGTAGSGQPALYALQWQYHCKAMRGS